MSNKQKTDLNDDCLSNIFKFLDGNDFLTVADTRKSFENAVKDAYKAVFGPNDFDLKHLELLKPLELNQSDSWRMLQPVPVPNRRIRAQIFTVGDSEMNFTYCLKFIRRFGQFITAAEIRHNQLDRNARMEIDSCLNKRCATTLQQIKLIGTNGITSGYGFEIPFTGLISLSIEGELGAKLSNFRQLFPNVEQLILDEVSFNKTDGKCIAVQLPRLQDLQIGAVFKSKHLVNCLQLSPQLQKLSFHDHSSNINSPKLHKILKCIN